MFYFLRISYSLKCIEYIQTTKPFKTSSTLPEILLHSNHLLHSRVCFSSHSHFVFDVFAGRGVGPTF